MSNHLHWFLAIYLQGLFQTLTETAPQKMLYVENARAVVQHLRTPSVRQILRSANKKKAVLDCATRWHSTLDMFQRLKELRECCSTNPGDRSFMSNITWDAIDDIITSLLPA